MWQITETRNARTTRERIWTLWADVDNWALWDPDVEYAALSGPFEVGTVGVFKSRGGPKSKFTIVEVVPNRSFTNRSRLPLCTLDFIHEVAETAEGIAVTHRVVLEGPLSPLFAWIVGRPQIKNLPVAVEALVRLAENG